MKGGYRKELTKLVNLIDKGGVHTFDSSASCLIV